MALDLIGVTKETNPKDMCGTRKTPVSTVSAPVIAEVGVAMLEGALKYGRHNYRVAGVRASVYYDASIRHLMDWYEGVDIDPDSGMSHITKAIAGLIVLRDAEIQGKLIDDRPPVSPAGWLDNLNRVVEQLLEKYKDREPPHHHTAKGLSNDGTSYAHPSNDDRYYGRVCGTTDTSVNVTVVLGEST